MVIDRNVTKPKSKGGKSYKVLTFSCCGLNMADKQLLPGRDKLLPIYKLFAIMYYLLRWLSLVK
ncbi:MAG: hypothetical protein ACETVS_01915 [Dehalococcoidales bacterium]